MGFRIGIDIGGTFTDFALLDIGSGRLVIHKQLTTPDDPSKAVLGGVPALLKKAGVEIGAVEAVVHGTTLITNALIERKGAITAMLCTAGFTDVLDIAMERRYDMYDMRIAYPDPLVPRHLRREVPERMLADGSVGEVLDLDFVAAAVEELVEKDGVEALAVCLLNAYANPAHEQAIAEMVARRFPSLYVSTSADIFPAIREYERWTTTTMNAFTQPMFDRYLDRLEGGLKALGFGGSFYIMTSSGGTVTPDTARRYPVRMLESGPAAGVLVSAHLGQLLDRPNLLAFDMGGTTAKGALIRDGAPLKRYEMEVARIHEFKMGSGLPAKIPVIDLIEIGAGGGSIAAVDIRGIISVGPHSAGAAPGPVCYGQGGDQPTLTDGNLLLGYLSADFFLGGEMALDKTRTSEVVTEVLSRPLDVSDIRAAWGIHETVNEDIARAFRNHASERGFDYRGCTMVAFGGSGPLHAARVARKLRVPTVVFPVGAGVASAVGLLISPLAFETARSTRVALSDLTAESLVGYFTPLVEEASGYLRPEGIPEDQIVLSRWLDMRYRGQGYDIEVTLPDLHGEALLAALPGLFAQAYEAVFGRSFDDEPIEITNWKVEAAGPRPITGHYTLDAAPGTEALKGTRAAYYPEAEGLVDCPVYDRYALATGVTLTGPALVEERESTCVIGVGDIASVDDHGNLIVETARQETLS
ncbi:MAG: hydantoinase/oxoprolinase family protein [Alphaproteobacteria bacterium]